MDFFAKLDNAVRNVLVSSLDVTLMFETARDLLKQFNLESGFTHDQASRDEFHGHLIRAAGTTGIPQMEDSVRIAGFLLPKILRDTTDLNVMQRVTAWLQKRGADQ